MPVHAEFQIDELWNLWPLARLSSSLAIGETLPPPWDPEEEPNYDNWTTYIDLLDEKGTPVYRSALLEDREGIFIPVTTDVFENYATDPGGGNCLSSLYLLAKEADILTAQLFAPSVSTLPSLHEAYSRLEAAASKSSYELEQYILVSLHEAASLAISARLPLYLDYFYPTKAEDTPMSSWDFDLYGFGCFSAARLTDEGQTLEILFPSGYRYHIPFPYFKVWFDDIDASCSRFASVEISPNFSDVEIRLDCGYEIGLGSMHFLKRIEPSYDEFSDFPRPYLEKLRPWLQTAEERRKILDSESAPR